MGTYMLENVVVGKHFLLQRIERLTRLEVSPAWQEIVDSREGRQPASVDGRLARVAAPASAQLLKEWDVVLEET